MVILSREFDRWAVTSISCRTANPKSYVERQIGTCITDGIGWGSARRHTLNTLNGFGCCTGRARHDAFGAVERARTGGVFRFDRRSCCEKRTGVRQDKAEPYSTYIAHEQEQEQDDIMRCTFDKRVLFVHAPTQLNFNPTGQAGNHPRVRGGCVQQPQQQGGRHLGRGERHGPDILVGVDVVGAGPRQRRQGGRRVAAGGPDGGSRFKGAVSYSPHRACGRVA